MLVEGTLHILFRQAAFEKKQCLLRIQLSLLKGQLYFVPLFRSACWRFKCDLASYEKSTFRILFNQAAFEKIALDKGSIELIEGSVVLVRCSDLLVEGSMINHQLLNQWRVQNYLLWVEQCLLKAEKCLLRVEMCFLDVMYLPQWCGRYMIVIEWAGDFRIFRSHQVLGIGNAIDCHLEESPK